MNVFCFTDEVFGVNTYALVEGKNTILIDPIDSAELGRLATENIMDMAVLTHEHYDHICGVNGIRQKYDIPILCGENAEKGLSDPAVNMSRYLAYLSSVIPFGSHNAKNEEYICCADGFLQDGQTIEWQGHVLKIQYTPGHSAGSIAVLVDDRLLFSGDTIFRDYPTATRIPGGSLKAFRTITEPWLNSLPGDVMVYPGHTEPFRLSERYHE